MDSPKLSIHRLTKANLSENYMQVVRQKRKKTIYQHAAQAKEGVHDVSSKECVSI